MKSETERLILRPFLPGDTKDLFEYLHAPTVNCFMDMKLDTLDDAKEEIAKRMKQTAESPSGLYYAIVLKSENKVIGEVFAHGEANNPTQSDYDTFSPCWMLSPTYQGKGYAYEAVSAFYDLLFKEMGARRIYIYTEDYNTACQKLCEKLGMRREGLFREFVSFVKGADDKPIYENTYQYAILKKEWLAIKKETQP